MQVFSVPIMVVPAGWSVDAPERLPVAFESEEVATATLRGRSYDFLMFQGNLTDGLTKGTLMLKPRYKDARDASGKMTRKYLAVEIIREEHFDIHRTES